MQQFDVFWTDKEGNKIALVEGREETMQVGFNADALYKTSASMTVHELPDWVNPYLHRVLVERDGEPTGFFIIDGDVPKTQRTNKTVTIGLVDPLKLVGVRELTQPVAVPQGANITSTVTKMLKDLGQTRLAVTPSSAVTLAPQVWMPGEHSWMNVINDLLTSANLWGLFTDTSGRFVVAPYLLPKARPLAHSFVAGDGSVLVGEYEEERDYLSVPNRFVAVCDNYVPEGSEEEPVTLVGVAENRNPASKFSYQARGEQWIEKVDRVEATSQADIDGIAARRLAAITGGGDYVSVKHLPVPGLWMHDRVHVSTAAGDVFDATVKEMRIPEHGVVSAKWTRISELSGGDL